jgi:iron(III) transport system permease protein
MGPVRPEIPMDPEIEEAARSPGCGRLNTVARITTPPRRRSLPGGWLIGFSVATRV